MNSAFVGFSAKPARSPRVFIVDQSGAGDFQRVKDACDYIINTKQPTGIAINYEIHIKPGVYAESPFTIPDGVTLIGDSAPNQQNFSGAESPTLGPNIELTSGAFITISGATSFVSFVNLRINFTTSASATADCFGINSNGYISMSGVRFTSLNKSPTFLHKNIYSRSLYASTCHFANNVSGGGVITNTWSIDTFQACVVKFCWFNGYQDILTSGGNTFIFMSKFGDAVSYGTEITRTGGNIYTSMSQYRTTSGTNIYCLERMVATEQQALREAYTASITPIIAKGAVGQTASLRKSVTSSDSAVETLSPLGELWLAVDPSRKVYMFNSFV